MKRVLSSLLLAVLLIGLFLWPGPVWLDSFARGRVRTVGARVLGVEVEAQDVHVSILRREIEVRGLKVANPPGFSSAPFIEIGTLTLKISPLSFLSEQGHITEIRARPVQLWIERQGLSFNYQPILDRLRTRQPIRAAALGWSGPSSVRIDQILLEEVTARVSLLASLAPLALELGAVDIRDVDTTNSSAALLQVLEQLLDSARGGQTPPGRLGKHRGLPAPPYTGPWPQQASRASLEGSRPGEEGHPESDS